MEKIVTVTDESEYYCGEYIEGRYYRGVYGGTEHTKDGTYVKVDGDKIKIRDDTKIAFDN